MTDVLAGTIGAAQSAGSAPALLPVRLCTSLPLGVAGVGPIAHGINNGVILATEQWRSRFKGAHLLLLPPLRLDDAARDGSRPDPNREKANARICVGKSDVLGFIGPVNSSMALVSEPVLNEAGMVQISPANTLVTLTSPHFRKLLEPATYHHRLAFPTYYRPVTTDLLQGPADAAFIQETLHARDYFLVDDPVPYGTGIAEAAQAYAARARLRLAGMGHFELGPPSSIAATASRLGDVVAAKQPGAVFCACSGPAAGTALVSALRRRGYFGPVVGPDVFLSPDVVTAAHSGVTNVYASDEGLDPAGASNVFRNAYRRRFHVQLQFYDVLAYDAANIALNAIDQAAIHGVFHGSLFQKRSAILPYVAHVRWHGESGITTFDRNGDTRNHVLSMYKVQDGRWRFVGTAPTVTGVSPTG